MPDAAKIGRRVGELSLGHAVNAVFVYGFDYGLYPFVIWKLGLIRGGAFMALLSLLVCILTFWFYDWSKRDWLGIESVKALRDSVANSPFRRFLAKTLARGDYLACVALSLYFDPFITTVYLRKGAYNGMNRRDWLVFLSSWIIGNGWWIAACFGGVSILEWLFAIVASKVT